MKSINEILLAFFLFFTFPITLAGVHLHGVFEVLAYTLGYRYYVYLRKQSHDLISDDNRLWIFIGAAAGAFLGSHLLGVLENPQIPLDWLRFMGNKTIVGGLLGGLIAVESTKKIIRVHTSSGDLMAYPIIFALSVGRLGCFAEGLEDGTYGIPTSLPWGINFGDNVFRHPTQLYEILFLCVLGITLSYLENHKKLVNGARFKLMMVSYLSFRLLIEFIKPNLFTIASLSTLQYACLLGLLYYWKVWLKPLELIENE